MFNAGIAALRPNSFRGSTAFAVSVVSLLALLLNVRFGTVAAAGFIGLWALYFLAWPEFCADAVFRTFLPWAFPDPRHTAHLATLLKDKGLLIWIWW